MELPVSDTGGHLLVDKYFYKYDMESVCIMCEENIFMARSDL